MRLEKIRYLRGLLQQTKVGNASEQRAASTLATVPKSFEMVARCSLALAAFVYCRRSLMVAIAKYEKSLILGFTVDNWNDSADVRR